MTTESVWREFEHDPRDPQYAGLRASDRDRAVVHNVLSSAYAEGRLDREELDDRTTAVTNAKTYAELLPPIKDLATDAAPVPFSLSSATELRQSAELHYLRERKEAIYSFLVTNLVVWAIWYLIGGGWPWPIVVTIPTALNALRVLNSRQEIIDKRVEKLQKRELKALEATKDDPDEKPEQD